MCISCTGINSFSFGQIKSISDRRLMGDGKLSAVVCEYQCALNVKNQLKMRFCSLSLISIFLLPLSQPPVVVWSRTSQSVGSCLLGFLATTATTWPATGCWRPLRARDFTFTLRRWHWLKMMIGKQDIQLLHEHCVCKGMINGYHTRLDGSILALWMCT